MFLRIPRLLVHVRLCQSISPTWDIGTVDIKRDQTPDLQLLVPDPIFIRILVEPVGNQLNDELFSTDD